VRIAITNDTAIAVEALRRVVTSVPRYQVAWIARNGEEAVEMTARDKPDAILMDLHMPGMGGVGAIRKIMDSTPCPILVVTATVEGHAAEVFEALAAGALDAVRTPVLNGDGEAASREHFLAKLHTIERLVGRKGPRAKGGRETAPKVVLTPRTFEATNLLAIGASAGGPGAVAEVLRTLPENSPPVVVVQHIDSQFAGGMADWLNSQTNLIVHVAMQGEAMKPGHVYLAGQDGHLVLNSDSMLEYIQLSMPSSYMPCIDVFFNSVTENWKGRVAAVLLTGMGRDGAVGLKTLRDTGALTIAQDRETSIVYGMPKAAVELDAAELVLPLKSIAPALLKFAGIQVRHV
jgi:two-component system response regulator WspF